MNFPFLAFFLWFFLCFRLCLFFILCIFLYILFYFVCLGRFVLALCCFIASAGFTALAEVFAPLNCSYCFRVSRNEMFCSHLIFNICLSFSTVGIVLSLQGGHLSS